jgi:hypothetical protein
VTGLEMMYRVAQARQPAFIDVYAGQSNVQSSFTTSGGVPTYIVPDPGVRIWDHDTARFFEYRAAVNSLQPTRQVDGGGGTWENWGPEAEFSYRIRQADPTTPVFIVKYSLGNTRLAADRGNDWSPSSTGSEYFQRVQTAIGRAKATILALGTYSSVTVRMVCWMQGEADCGNARYDAEYLANLTAFETAVRSRWGDANTKLIIGRINHVWELNPNTRRAQVTVGDSSSLNAWINTDGYSLTSNHFNDIGTSQFGRDVYLAYAKGHSNKIANGDFSAGTSSWLGLSRSTGTGVVAADDAVLGASSGTLLVTNYADHNVAGAVQPINGLTVGATYKVLGSVTRTDNPGWVQVVTDSRGMGSAFGGTGADLYKSGFITSPTSVDGSFIASATTHYLALFNFSSGKVGTVGYDNVKVVGP